MKICKRITAMIMAAAMLFMLAVNASAANPFVCRERTLVCGIAYITKPGSEDWIDGNDRGMIGKIYITPTIEEQGISSGVYEYGISDVDANFAIYVPTLDFFEKNEVITDNLSAVITISIEYNISFGRTKSVSYSIRQNIPKISINGSGHDGYSYSSSTVHFSIPDMIDIDKSYQSTQSITANVHFFPNSGTSAEIDKPVMLLLPTYPNNAISMSSLISEIK